MNPSDPILEGKGATETVVKQTDCSQLLNVSRDALSPIGFLIHA